MLEINRINVFYGKTQVLWDLSLKVNKGSIVSIIGSNGAGKTTLLKTIAGIVKPASGEIKFLGEKRARARIDKLRAFQIVEKGISLVPEGRELFPMMTVLENLEMGCFIKRAEKHKQETLEFVFQLFPRLKERQNQLARTLSGGEQQMLALGRALMAKPKLMLLDEPSAGLMPILAIQLLGVIKKLREEGLTVILVEQNVHYALDICDEAYVLEQGKIVLSGSGKDLKDKEAVKKAYLGM